MSIAPIDPYDRLVIDPPTSLFGGGRCELCGKWCPSLVELADHYAPSTAGARCPARRPQHTHATSGHRAGRTSNV